MENEAKKTPDIMDYSESLKRKEMKIIVIIILSFVHSGI